MNFFLIVKFDVIINELRVESILMKFGIFTKIFFYFFITLIINPLSVFSNEVNEKGIVSLMYHRFEENKYPSTNIRIYDFKKHINLVNDSQLKFISFNEIKKILIEKKPYVNKKILLTIDDGFKSFYKNAWPILKKKKYLLLFSLIRGK